MISFALLFGTSLFLFRAGGAGANFATSYVVLTTQARGLIPNVAGAIKAKVAANLVLSLQFTLNAGAGYAAGLVTATTDSKGRIFKLVKLRQTCTFYYTSTSAVQKVTCTSSRRELEGDADPTNSHEETEDEAKSDISHDLEQGTVVESGVTAHRRLASCSSCLGVVTASFPTRLQAVCGKAVAQKIPTTFLWARSAATALCYMATKLGKPTTLAYKTCRCTCLDNVECPSTVCSGGLCLAQKLAAGQRCYDDDDDDCLNGHCARSSYPFGVTICCPSGGYVYSPYGGDYYCDGQGTGATCDSYTNDICASGVCSGGKCLASRIGPGGACPDYDDDQDCANDRCALNSYPLGDPVCCPSGEYAIIYDFQSNEYVYYCTAIQGVGLPCSWQENKICISGVCLNSTCIAGKLQDGDFCTTQFDDNDCLSGNCAYIAYPSGDAVCCSATKVYSPGQFQYYCPGIQGTGSECDANGLCSSGVCSGGACVAQKLGSNETCPDREDDDCVNGRCARISYPDGVHVCCPTDSYVNSSTSGDIFCTGIQGIGSFCDSNEICESGVCSEGLCAAAT
jgi:hypothetical protein